MKKEVKVIVNKKKGGVEPKQGYEDDFAVDVYSSKGVLVPPLTFKSVKIPTGLHTDFDPKKFGMRLCMRSGTSSKTPLFMPNSDAVIEGTYRDEIGILVRNSFIDSRLVTFALTAKGEKIDVSRIPKHVLKDARDLYDKEMELLEYPEPEDNVKENLYRTIVPAGTIYIAKHESVAQMYFDEKIHPVFERGELSDSERGARGFGSSGTSYNKEETK